MPIDSGFPKLPFDRPAGTSRSGCDGCVLRVDGMGAVGSCVIAYHLGPLARCPSLSFFCCEGSPANIDYRKKLVPLL